MSDVFAGVVVNSPAAAVRAAVGTFAEGTIQCVELRSGGCVLYGLEVVRRKSWFDSRADEIAAELSRKAAAALVVRYDARVGLRTARLYREGCVAGDFGECDETYVPLDDDGAPLCDAPTVQFCRLDPLTEYETEKNAIEIGLEALGCGTWIALKKIIGQA